MNEKRGKLCIGLGVCLLLGALGLWMYNQCEDNTAGTTAQNNLITIQQSISQSKTTTVSQQTPSDSENSEVTIAAGGNDYIGYLSIPSLELELPVLSSWSYDKLKLAPCQQFGAVSTKNLVIAGHNYTSHFGTLNQMVSGDALSFTDANGNLYRYIVDEVKIISSTDVDIVEQSGYDLVLYTCTVGGTNRVAVFCSLQEEYKAS